MEDAKVKKSQILILLCISLHFAIVSINHTKPTFQNYVPHEISSLEVGYNISSTQANVSYGKPQTHEYNTNASHRHEVNIVSEWHLIHKRCHLSTLVVTLYFLGVVIGSMPAGFMADRFGRRIVMVSCLYGQGIMSILIFFNKSFTIYAILRTLQGFFIQGLQNSSYTLLIELFPTRWRICVAWMTEICWTVGLVILALISYWFPNWREAELISTLPFLVLSLFYLWFLPESPRWKYTKNNIIEFEQLCNEPHLSQRTSINEYTNEPQPIKGLEYLSSENFVSKHANTVPNFKPPDQFMTINNSFASIKSENNRERLTGETLDSYGSIEDLRISLSSIWSEFDLTIQECKKSFNAGLICKVDEDKMNGKQRTLSEPSDDLGVCFITNQLSSKKRPSEMIAVKEEKGPQPMFDIMYDEDTMKQIDSVLARDRLLRELNKCVKRECCRRKTLDEILLLIEQNRLTKNGVRHVCREMIRNARIRGRLIIVSYLWFATSLSYYGVTFSLPALSGDRFWNFCYGAWFEFVSFTITCVVLCKVGRKFPLLFFYLLTSSLFIFIFTSSLLPMTHVSESTKTLLVLLGKGSIVGTFFCDFIYGAELFPTPMRAACTGIASLFCRLGSLISPYLLILAKNQSKDKMFLLLGILSFFAALLTLCLPETHRKTLPDTVDDALQLARRSPGLSRQLSEKETSSMKH